MLKDELAKTRIINSASLSYRSYRPKQYSGKQKEYNAPETRTFIQEKAKYSSNYVEAEVQGLNPEEPFEYTKVHLRFTDIVSNATLTSTADDHKRILIAERQYEYLRKGAKIIALGSVWLVDDPRNMGDGGTAVVRRCDTTWNYLDYYGNLCREPLAVNLDMMRASTPDSQRSTMITKGYFPAAIQSNAATKQLFHNSRIILGSSAYMLTGFSDFQAEFTFEDDSVGLMEFALRYDEPNDNTDDMVNRVAGGKTFAWDINVLGSSTLTVGDTEQFMARSTRSYLGETEEVSSTEEHPVSYSWESSDESVLTVDAEGNVTAVGEGIATIRVILDQNPDRNINFTVNVEGIDADPHVAFLNSYPGRLPYGSSITFEAYYYEEGRATEQAITWTANGADEEAYTIAEYPNQAAVTCWGGSVTPLTITASYGEHSVSHTLWLEGI